MRYTASSKIISIKQSLKTHLDNFCNWIIILFSSFQLLNPIPARGGQNLPPPTIFFAVKGLKHIERPCNFLTFPEYGFQTDL